MDTETILGNRLYNILMSHQRGAECQCGFPYFFEREHTEHVARVIAKELSN